MQTRDSDTRAVASVAAVILTFVVVLSAAGPVTGLITSGSEQQPVVQNSVASTGSDGGPSAIGSLGAIEAEERGDVVEIPITGISGSDYVTVSLGSRAAGYVSNVTVADQNGDDAVTLEWNSYTADGGQAAGDGTWQAVGADTIVNQNVESTIADGPDHVIATGTYEVRATAGRISNGAASSPPGALDVVRLEPRSTNGVTVWTADERVEPRIASADDITAMAGDEIVRDDTIANSDLLIVQIEASGLEGVFAGQDATGPREQFYDAVAAGTVSLTHEQISGSGPNTGRESLSVNRRETADRVTVRFDAQSDTYYVIQDLGTESVFTAGQRFETTFRVAAQHQSEAAYGLVTPEGGTFTDETVDTAFEVRESGIEFNTAVSGDVDVRADTGQPISGTTSLAPGSALDIRLQTKSGAATPFILEREAVVQQDRTWVETVDFSAYQEGVEFTIDVAHNGNEVTATEDGKLTDRPTVGRLSFSDQETRGELVTVDAAQLSAGGFVVLREGAPDGPVIGVSSPLDPGETQTDLRIPLSDPLDTAVRIYATAHLDTDADGEFDFISSDGTQDGPYERNGSPVTRTATVQLPGSVASTSTPTETQTPAQTETMTPEPPSTEPPDRTESTSDLTLDTARVTEGADGPSVVTLSTVELPEGGFVAIHANTTAGPVVGVSEYLAASDRITRLEIDVDETVSGQSSLVAVAHQDTDGDRQFEYSGGSADRPYRESGEAVAVVADGRSSTPTPAGVASSGGLPVPLPVVLGAGVVLVGVLGYGVYRVTDGQDGDDTAGIVDDAMSDSPSGRGSDIQTPDADASRPHTQTSSPSPQSGTDGVVSSEESPSADQRTADTPATEQTASSVGGGESSQESVSPSDSKQPADAAQARSTSSESATGPDEHRPAASPADQEPGGGSAAEQKTEAAADTEESDGGETSQQPADSGQVEADDTEQPTETRDDATGTEPSGQSRPSAERGDQTEAGADSETDQLAGETERDQPTRAVDEGSSGDHSAAGAAELAEAVDSLIDVTPDQSGGAIATYRATQVEPEREIPVQVRAGAPDAAFDQRTVDWFAQIAGAWYDASRNPNIRTVYDWDLQPRPWIAVETLPGSQSITAAAESRTPADIVGLVDGAIQALAAIDSSHLGLSPDSIQVFHGDSGPVTVVGGWGLDRLFTEAATGDHVTAYTAPEQLDPARTVDARTDVYGLAAVTYEALTGRPPVDASRTSIQEGDIVRPAEVVQLPQALDATLMYALAPNPADRYVSPTAFGHALRDSV